MKIYSGFILFLIAAIIGAGGCASENNSPETSATRTDRCEYKTVSLQGYSMGVIQTKLMLLGEEGWQPVNSHLTVRQSGSDYVVVVTLKRPR